MNSTGNTILITGGGSGIGRALARRFARLGNTVIVAGRQAAALEETIAGHDGMHAVVLDVTQAADVEAVAQRVLREHPDLNVLLNNAGIMRVEQSDRRRDLMDAAETIAANLLGPIQVTNAFIDHLVSRSDATIINVSSGLAFVPRVDTPTYNATKAAIHSYTVALRESLKDRVEVIELVPPAVQTGLTPGQETRAGYLPLAEFIEEVIALLGQMPTPAEILVERVRPLRGAEASGRFDDVLARVNAATPLVPVSSVRA